MAKTAYKQTIEHINQSPTKLRGIDSITHIVETRYNSNLPKTNDQEEFLKRPIRYTFRIDLKSKIAQPAHIYIYDNKQDAENAYKFHMRNWIDEQIEPFRKLVKHGNTLTIKQIEKCKRIQALLPED